MVLDIPAEIAPTPDVELDIKTSEDRTFVDDYYGPAEGVPTYMRPYKRYRGLEYHQYRTLVELNGQQYANRIRNYLQSDPRHRFEILANKKIDSILEKLRGSLFSNLIFHYERYQHAKFIDFLSSLSAQYLKTSSVAQYLFLVFLNIMETTQGRRPSLVQFRELYEAMELKSRPSFKDKMALIDAGVIQEKRFDERREMEVRTVVEDAAQIVYSLGELPPEKRHSVVTSLRTTAESYGIVRRGSRFRAELLVLLTFLETEEEDIEVSLKTYIRELFKDPEVVSGTYSKLYRLRSGNQEIMDLLSRFSFGRTSEEERHTAIVERSTLEDSDIKREIREYMERAKEMVPDVVTGEELNQAVERPQVSLVPQKSRRSREETSFRKGFSDCHSGTGLDEMEVDYSKNIHILSEPCKVTRTVLHYVRRYVEETGACILDHGDIKERVLQVAGEEEAHLFADRWKREEELDTGDFVIVLDPDLAIPECKGHMALRRVDLRFNTLNYETIQRWGEVLPHVQQRSAGREIIIEQPARYLMEFARSLTEEQRIEEVSVVIVNGRPLWIAWWRGGGEIIAGGTPRRSSHYKTPQHPILNPSPKSLMTLVAGNRGVRHGVLLKALITRRHQISSGMRPLPPFIWFGSRASLFRAFVAVGARTDRIHTHIQRYEITVVDEMRFSELTDLALFVKFQMPRLPRGSIILFPNGTELISKMYISESIANKTPEDFYQELMWKKHPEFEETFAIEYGEEYVRMKLRDWEHSLDYVPTNMERGAQLHRVKEEVEKRWIEEFEKFKLMIMRQASELYQWARTGNAHHFESDYSMESKETIMECLRAIRDVTVRDGVHISLVFELFDAFRPTFQGRCVDVIPGVSEFIQHARNTYEERTERLIQRLIHSRALDKSWHILYLTFKDGLISAFSKTGGDGVWSSDIWKYREYVGVVL